MKPPDDLVARGRGRRLWRSVTGEFDLRADEVELLVEACRMVDLADALRRQVADEGTTVVGPQGMRTHRRWRSCGRHARSCGGRWPRWISLTSMTGRSCPATSSVLVVLGGCGRRVTGGRRMRRRWVRRDPWRSMTVLDALRVELAARREAAGDLVGNIESTDELLDRLGFASVEEMRDCAARVRASSRERWRGEPGAAGQVGEGGHSG